VGGRDEEVKEEEEEDGTVMGAEARAKAASRPPGPLRATRPSPPFARRADGFVFRSGPSAGPRRRRPESLSPCLLHLHTIAGDIRAVISEPSSFLHSSPRPVARGTSLARSRR